MGYNLLYVPTYHSPYYAMRAHYYDEVERLMGWNSTHTKSESKSKYKKHIYSLNFQVK